jgi:hypothetical protein
MRRHRLRSMQLITTILKLNHFDFSPNFDFFFRLIFLLIVFVRISKWSTFYFNLYVKSCEARQDERRANDN